MRLPNPGQAVVDPSKIRDYLLSREHPWGRSKAVVFEAFGYRRQAWHILQADLAAIAAIPGAVPKTTTEHGRKFELRATLKGPLGWELSVLTVWIVRWGEEFPRLVTAYPRGRK